MFYLIGLGNRGEEYQNTRHNIGRDLVFEFCQKNDFGDFKFDKKTNTLIAKGLIGKNSVTAVLPEGFMNNSGKGLNYYIKNLKQAEKMIVIHDDLDLSIGNFKIQFNRGSAGHKGVESINKALKTEKYIRIKIGISDLTASGKIKKPKNSDAVVKHVLGKFNPKQNELLKKNKKKCFLAIETIINFGYKKAMNDFN